MDEHHKFLRQAVLLALKNKSLGGRPFGAVIVKDGEEVSSGVNEMMKSSDPTSHAELEAIRSASKKMNTLSLEGCSIYASGHPCPMCLAAIITTNIKALYYAFDNDDASPYGFSSEATYSKLGIQLEELELHREKLDVGIIATELYKQEV